MLVTHNTRGLSGLMGYSLRIRLFFLKFWLWGGDRLTVVFLQLEEPYFLIKDCYGHSDNGSTLFLGGVWNQT
jgi:hypothetical protein